MDGNMIENEEVTEVHTVVDEPGKPENKTLAVAGVMGVAPRAIVPRDVDEAWRYAGMIMAARMAPPSYKSQSEVLIGIVKGLELNMTPLTALSAICVINNRPTVWGDGAVGLLWASGKVEDFKEWEEEVDGIMTAFCEITRKGSPTPIKRSFSQADAMAAGLATKKGPWTEYPRRMRQMRARAWAIRDGFADVLTGLAITEEVLDYRADGAVMIEQNGSYEVVKPTPVTNPLDDDSGSDGDETS